MNHFDLLARVLARSDPTTKIGALVVAGDVQYYVPMVYNQVVKIHLRLKHIGTSSYTVEYCAVDADTGKLCYSGSTVMVWFDHSRQQTLAIPDRVRVALREIDEHYASRDLYSWDSGMQSKL